MHNSHFCVEQRVEFSTDEVPTCSRDVCQAPFHQGLESKNVPAHHVIMITGILEYSLRVPGRDSDSESEAARRNDGAGGKCEAPWKLADAKGGEEGAEAR
eukprot:3809146-Rhodomonas_salina.1